MKIKHYSRYFASIIYCATLLNYALGYHGAKGKDILFVAVLLLAISFNKLLRKIIFLPLLFITAIYFPIGYLYGHPSLSIIASFFQTNNSEAIEFIRSIPAACYALPFTLLIGYVFIKKSIIDIQVSSHVKAWSTLPFLLLTLSLGVEGKLSDIKLVKFLISTQEAYQDYKYQIAKLQENSSAEWKIQKNSYPGKNMIIIIGESMRADYMSVYGYPLLTTPFLSKINGTFYRNYISAAPNTFLSLPRTLSLSSGASFDISYNIINLAKQAGYETFWLSNQGLLGKFDTPTSRLAMFSDHSIFLKKGDYASLNKDDFELIPSFQHALFADYKHKLIVLHIMGSHPRFEERLSGEKPFFHFSNHDISNYISTYRRTDAFIKTIYNMASEAKEPFKIIYFSDHGLTQRNIDGHIYLRHGVTKKENYHVPLLILSSDANQRIYIDTPVSAFDFISFFAQEAGIKVIHPKLPKWAESGKEIKVFSGETMVSYNKLGDEPPVILH